MESVALKGSEPPIIEGDHLSRTVRKGSVKTDRLILEIKALDSGILCHFKIPCAVSQTYYSSSACHRARYL